MGKAREKVNNERMETNVKRKRKRIEDGKKEEEDWETNDGNEKE